MKTSWIPLLALLVLPAVLLSTSQVFVAAEAVEDGDAVVEDENEMVAEEEPDSGKPSTGSIHADTLIHFIEPLYNPLSTLELPAGKPVEFLIGFKNKGEVDFIVETVNTSFRYPMDYSFYIQNFSTIAYNKVVKPDHEATFFYSFIPSEAFAGRPFGLNVNLGYKDSFNDISYSEAVFNETVQIIELDEGLDGETVFLYIFLAACVILTLVGGQQLLSSFGRKSRSSSRKTTVEVGTSNPNNVDYDWIPRETLNMLNKSPKTPKQSPRQRKVKRSAGFDD
ncbi:hypothetical protein QAD02_000986 [Eretmocerus hayati]|uniref:Uncharacterized protein n=1 Tax=Eretmocerus hayati TaxID=131215 RepID=A0ACC2NF52_9HYME|nr:hypothetical protein QAD02_000986 [Eretmocerus hayati]